MQTEQLNKNIAESLRTLLNCGDDELVLAARDELPKERKELVDALKTLGVYYSQKQISQNCLIPTPEFAFYIPYMKILDNPCISEKYDFYCERKEAYQEEQKQKKIDRLQELINSRWQRFQNESSKEGISLAASKQSGDERLRSSGHGGPCIFKFTSQDRTAHGLTLVIRRSRENIDFIVKGTHQQVNHITSLKINGKSIRLEEGCGEMAVDELVSVYLPIYVVDDEGNQMEMSIVLDENGNQLE